VNRESTAAEPPDDEPPEPDDPVLRDAERNERRALRWLAEQVELGHADDLDRDAFAKWVFGKEDAPSMIGQLHAVLGGPYSEPERLAAGRVIYSPSKLRRSLLAAGRPAVRGALASGLRAAGPPTVDMRAARARAACLWGVFKLGGDDTHEIISGVLPSSDQETRFEIIRILGFMGDRRGTRVLVDALSRETSSRNRSDILWALGTLADPAALQPCVAALKDSNPEARGYAAWALGEMGDPGALPALRDALNDPDPEVRGWVSTAVLKLESSR
jgi:hypothetical protein